jgi:hypothetical protein
MATRTRPSKEVRQGHDEPKQQTERANVQDADEHHDPERMVVSPVVVDQKQLR